MGTQSGKLRREFVHDVFQESRNRMRSGREPHNRKQGVLIDMSVMKSNGERVILPRLGREDFWKLIHEHYAHQNAHRWKALAILALRENAGWPLDAIAAVFQHHPGHISRILVKIKREMRENFQQSPEWLGMGDPDEFEELQDQSDREKQEAGFSNPQRQSD